MTQSDRIARAIPSVDRLLSALSAEIERFGRSLVTAEVRALLDAIRSATMVPARYLGIDDRLGSVEAGKVADIVGVPGDPVADVHVLERVSFVMKEGVIYKR